MIHYVKTLEDLVQCLIDNDPDEPIADNGMTVLDGWRKDAERALRSSQAESSEYDDSVSAEDVRGILPHSPPMQAESADFDQLVYWKDQAELWKAEAERLRSSPKSECSIGVNNPGICSAGNCRRCDDWKAGWDAAIALSRGSSEGAA